MGAAKVVVGCTAPPGEVPKPPPAPPPPKDAFGAPNPPVWGPPDEPNGAEGGAEPKGNPPGGGARLLL